MSSARPSGTRSGRGWFARPGGICGRARWPTPARRTAPDYWIWSGGADRSGRTLVIQVCPQSFLETERIIALMRRELLHVADMLEEKFGYVHESFSGEPSQQDLQRDRYRVLWNTYLASRLERERVGDEREKERLARAFGRVLASETEGIGDGVFRRVFDAPSLTHREFMEWARELKLLFNSPLVA